jgi:nucleoside-diphosphate-sugar epimerase
MTNTPRTIVVAGGTGFIGAALIEAVVQRTQDDRIVAIAHSDRSAQQLRARGAEVVQGDMTMPGGWQDVVATADVVIQAAQPTTFGRRLTKAVAEKYGAQRLSMDRQLLAAFDRGVASGRRTRLIYVSGNSYFGETGPTGRADETMTPQPTGFGPYIQAPVGEVRRRLADGHDVVIAFPGSVYGDGAWLKQYTLDPLRKGKPVGELSGRSRVASPIAVTDVARALIHLSSVPSTTLDSIGRLVFLVDDHPMTFHEINEIAAASLGITPKYRKIPAPLMRLFAGSVAYSYLATDASYSNARLKQLGFSLTYPTAKEGIHALLNKPG